MFFLWLYTICLLHVGVVSDPGDPVQAGGYLGALWSHSELQRDENFFLYNQTYVHPDGLSRREDCLVMCGQTQLCVGYVFSAACGPGPWTCALHLHGTDIEAENTELSKNKHFKMLHGGELEIEAGFYDYQESTHYLISGTTVLRYDNLDDFALGPSDYSNHTSHFFSRWGGQIDDIFERPIFDGDTLIKYHLIKGEHQYYYIHLINETTPYRKMFDDTTGERVHTVFGTHIPSSIGAALDLRKCTPPCPVNEDGQESPPFLVTYFFKGEYIYESPAETWLEWDRVNGTKSYHINSQHNVDFPGIPSGMTAALKLHGSDQNILFFKGLNYYLYDMQNKTLTDLGNVSLCAPS